MAAIGYVPTKALLVKVTVPIKTAWCAELFQIETWIKENTFTYYIVG